MSYQYLYKVSLKATDSWSRYTHKKLRPIYVVQSTKEDAKVYAERHLREGLSVKSVSLLAEQYGGCMFGSAGD